MNGTTAIPLTLLTLAAMVWLLQSCGVIQKPPADWPKLTVIVMQNVPKLVASACPGEFVFGCTVVDFKRGTCHVLMTTDSESDLNTELSHGHCSGYDHAGETQLRDAWKAYAGNMARNNNMAVR